ncbi:hypothetical protein KAT92_02130 [Candidatus Babeliales bacterium]|nr:hypothetical protein [Candidatus Babeliales bacterium]
MRKKYFLFSLILAGLCFEAPSCFAAVDVFTQQFEWAEKNYCKLKQGLSPEGVHLNKEVKEKLRELDKKFPTYAEERDTLYSNAMKKIAQAEKLSVKSVMNKAFQKIEVSFGKAMQKLREKKGVGYKTDFLDWAKKKFQLKQKL